MSTARTAILLVGGLGTRMHPLTVTRPKHLLPVGGVPVLDLQLRRLREAGVRRAALATARHADLVARHVAAHPVAGLEVVISDEGTPLGTGGGLLAAMEVLSPDADEPVVIVNGDLLTGHDLRAQTAACRPGVDVVLHVRAAADPAPFGTVEIAPDGRHVVGFREKVPGPAGTLVNAGTYVVRPGALAGRASGQEQSWERDVLPAIIAEGADVIAHRDDAWFADIGSPAALLAATRAALDGTARTALPQDFDPAAAISPSTTLGEGARLEDSTTGTDVHVAAHAAVSRCVLLDGVRVGAGSRLTECVIGAGAIIDDGVTLRGVTIADDARIRADQDATADEGSTTR